MAPYINDLMLKKRDFDTRVEMEVQKATLAMKIEMIEKMSEAKIEMEAMDKKFLEVKEEAKSDKEAMERKLSEAKRDMEEIIADKVKKGIQAYIESLGINLDANLKSKKVPDNSLEDCQQSLSHVPVVQTKKVPDHSLDDCQQSLSPIPVVHTKKANMIKKTGTSVVGKTKKKWVNLKKTTKHQTSFLFFQREENIIYIVTPLSSIPQYVCF